MPPSDSGSKMPQNQSGQTTTVNPSVVIAKKRDCGELSRSEIDSFIEGYTTGAIPDYQMSALAMAIFLRGMTGAETAALTDAMLNSGIRLRRPTGQVWVDKHSTGGIGDKTSLILAPVLACCGLRVPMISGRGLGATGGTLDKLESIPGFRTNLSIEEINRIVEDVGCVITGASAEIAPADKRLYALRDVTATVPSIPLITASIMSKKLAESLDTLVLDVKTGSGAFMKTLDESRALADSLVETGRRMGVKTSALITDMNQPLGRMAGNAVEVNESLDVLNGAGPDDLVEVTRALAAKILVLAGISCDTVSARSLFDKQIQSGNGLRKFEEMVKAQGGDLTKPRPVAPAHELSATREGYVCSIDAEKLGIAIIELGGGRRVITDPIDFTVGLEMCARIGDRVELGQTLVRVFSPKTKYSTVEELIRSSIEIGDSPTKSPPLIYDSIGT